MNIKMSRKTEAKRLFATLMSILMLAFPLCVPVSAADDADKISFAVVSGLSYVSEENRGGYNEAFLIDAKANGCQYAQLDSLLDSSLASIKSRAENGGLEYVLVNGSLTYSGEYANHQELSQRLLAFEEETGVQVIVMGGGTDINSASASCFANGSREYIKPATAREFSTLYSDLGYDIASSRFTSGGATNAGLSYSVVAGSYRIIVIDATYYQYKNGYTAASGRISDNLLKWIKNECQAAQTAGQTVIGMCSWSLDGNTLVSSDGILENADEAANALADAGMHYIYTAGTGKNDISAIVSDNGNVIYDIQSAPLVGFPNTYRVSSFEGEKGTFDVVDADEAQPICSYDGAQYEQPYRETASLRIQYYDYDLADYCADIVKNYVGTVLIPGVEANGTLDAFVKSRYGSSLTDIINEKIGGGLTLFDSVTLFDASNIMNMLEDMYQQALSSFLKDDETLAELCRVRLRELFDTKISSVPCTAFLDTYGFGSDEHGGTIGDLLLSMIVYSTCGNENSASDAFVNDVIDGFRTGDTLTLTAEAIGTTLIKELLFGDILSQIELKPSYLLFFDDSEGSIGSYIQIAFRGYIALHGESASVTGAVNSALKDGFFKEYGRSIDEVIAYFINYYYSGADGEMTGKQIADIIESFVADSDPREMGDYGVSYDGSEGSASYATRENYRLPSMITVTPGNDTTSEAYITWYTKSTVEGSDIEIYSDKNSKFYGNHFIGVDGVTIITESNSVERQYNLLDLGFISLGETTLTLTRHTAKLMGLKPGETYYFRVGDSSKGWWSDTASVTTANDSESLTFIHVADTSGRTEEDFSVFNNVLGCVNQLYPGADFILHTGNYVENNSDLNQWRMLLDGSSDALTNNYIVPVAGTNDTVDTIKNNFAIGAILGESERNGVYYSFDYNIAHIAVLDSNRLNDDGSLDDEQLEWFKADMSATSAKWKIVAIHNPVYTNGAPSQESDYSKYMNKMSALMDEYDVDAVFTDGGGVYYRTNAMRSGDVSDNPTVSIPHQTNSSLYYSAIPDPSGTVYSSLGSSGSLAYESHETNNVSKVFTQSGKNLNPECSMFTSVEIYGDTLYLTSYTLDGVNARRVDGVAIKKGATSFGDVNFDGKVTAADARLILRAAAQLDLLTASQYAVADMNGDSKITAADARAALRISAQLDS